MKRWIAGTVLLFVLLVAGGYTYESYKQASQGIERPRPENGERGQRPDSGRLAPFGPRGPMGDGPMVPEAERQRMAKELGLTDDQQKKIEKIFEDARELPMQERFQAMAKAREVMTPEQQKKMESAMSGRREEFMKRRMEEAKKRMSPEEFTQYENRMKAMREKMDRGESPFPGGGRPPWMGGGRGGRGGDAPPADAPKN